MPFTFNSSIWSALLLVTPLGIVVFLRVFFSLKKGHHYFFDPKHNVDPRLRAEGVTYDTLAKRYQDIGTLLITLSTAAIGFLISVITADKSNPSVFVQRLQTVAPIVVGLFGTSVACLVLFMTVQALWYEEYCHSPEHNSYKRWKYAVSTSLGWTGALSFLLAFLWLARNLFRA